MLNWMIDVIMWVFDFDDYAWYFDFDDYAWYFDLQKLNYKKKSID